MNALLANCHAAFVNLDHRPDRLSRMRQSLERVGIKAERQRGMLPSEYRGDPKRVQTMMRRTPGAVGCHFAQVAVMERAKALGKHAFVMEDDLIFCRDFHERIAHIEGFIANHDWDILWLGGTFHINPPHWHKPRDAQLTDDPRMIRTFGAFCTYAYIVRDSRIEIVLAMLDRELDRSIGIDYAMIQMQPHLLTYAFVPGCVKQFDNRSDIGSGMTRFSGFSKLGPYWWADKMGDFDPTTYNWHEAKI